MVSEKELNRCLPCRKCEEKPQERPGQTSGNTPWIWFGCSCLKFFLGYTEKHERDYRDVRKRWNRYQRGSNFWYSNGHYTEAIIENRLLREQGVDKEIRDQKWRATVNRCLVHALQTKEAAERAHGQRMADLALKRRLKIQELQSKIQKLEAQLEKQKNV